MDEEEDLFDDEFLLDNSLSSEVLQAISLILPSEDPLEKPDFDLVEYINELFPNEQSLSNLDEIINKDKSRIKRVDNEIRAIIHNQSETSDIGKASLEDAQKAIIHLFSQIKDIKYKAEKSEEMVKEITRDIKNLDIAKKNLTQSITTLNNLFILVENVETLENLLNGRNKNYSEMATAFERVINVIDHFVPYNHIEQIENLSQRVKSIKNQLIEWVKKDFEDDFSNPFNKLNPKHAKDLCRMVDVLDNKLKNDLIRWFLKKELREYGVLFEENQENSWLDKIDRRYSWIKRSLAEFEEKYNKIFPNHWEMSERLAVEFCQMTKNDLSNVMNKRKIEMDNKLLVFAIQRTANFEQLLDKRFVGKSLASSQTDLQNENWKPFIGIISQCFDHHFDIYVNFTDQTLSEMINRFAEEVKQNGFPKMQNDESTNLLSSSADLFIFYKNCMTQCLQMFTDQTLLHKLTPTFQKYLREYSNRILSSNLPKTSSNSSSSSYSSISGAATSLIQNFQMQLKESNQSSNAASASMLDSSKKLNEAEIGRICSILCTAEYCLDTTQQLEDKLKEKVSQGLKQSNQIEDQKQIEFNMKKINLNNEKEFFSNVISSCIQTLVQDLENSCEPALIAMTKIPWQNFSAVGDQSSYVTAIINHLKASIPFVRDNLANSRKYFTQFCSKFAANFIQKYINNILKCKNISQIGVEQLLLDTHSLKTALLEMPSLNSAINRKAPTMYGKVVNKEMSKVELILKSVMAPGEPITTFVDNYLRLLPEQDIDTFRLVVEMKGYKKNDVNLYVEVYKSKLAGSFQSKQRSSSPKPLN